MSTSVKMPQLGETVIEGTILKWLKKEGESIDVDEPLFEISTDKVDTEVPSPAGGTVSKILVPEGETVSVETFEPGDKVKVSGISIGKGFAGTIKRHNFSRGPVSHGSHNVRKPGSIGASATPSRVFKGVRMAGRMGGKRVTQVGLTVHSVDTEQNLLLVRGAVPGPKNGIVEIREQKRH